MSDALVFPDTRGALFDLIDDSTHEGETVRAVYHLPADEYGSLQAPFPIAHIYGAPGGTIGYIDRVDRRVIDVYAPGEQAVNVLESITAFICGAAIETPSAYLDEISCETSPEDIPYQSDTLNKATATFLVTTRPIN
ncbi:hypothetical protein [Pseudarthrobacter sp. NIBRBAC000502770]|uniref:hypothetical protein n=1 Tax=Pseudarthrobacter sp. NIBRBAC000502770 TaxID=2590785 RepID=UPI001140656C|nr:hypothetical protein [Pseudarthrobacter sp. NIBRBAC000502770]QDG90704.1 hypothetical protein NIBR502770_21000 [Pseudarthrobacter sp. NIBRBAC000502770]